MADKPHLTLPWYQQKKWVVSTGLVCGVGLGLLLIPPVADEIVPLLLSESSSEPEPAAPEPAEPEATEATETTSAAETAMPDSDTEDASDDATQATDANSETPQPEGPYDLVVFNTEEVTSDDLVLMILRAELNVYPVDKTKLRSAVEAEIEQFRGTAHAVSVEVFYDRREGSSPAFGAWEWAPQGDRTKADEGDPDTWQDYEWAEPERNKFNAPETCDPPAEAVLNLSGAYYSSQFTEPEEAAEPLEDPGVNDSEEPEEADDAPDNDGVDLEAEDPFELPTTTVPTDPDPEVMDDAADEIGTTGELLTDALSKTAEWAAC